MESQKTFSKYRLWCGAKNQLKENGESIEEKAENIENAFNLSEQKKDWAKAYQVDQKRFLSIFDLVTIETGEILLKKTQERKRRACASPHILSQILQAEKQDLDGNDPPTRKKRLDEFLPCKKKPAEKKWSSPSPLSTPSSTPSRTPTTHTPSQDENYPVFHIETCNSCKKRGDLLLCECCPLSYHAQCARVKTIPKQSWFCPKCEERAAKIDLTLPPGDEKEMLKKLEEKKRGLLNSMGQLRTKNNEMSQQISSLQVKNGQPCYGNLSKKIASHKRNIHEYDALLTLIDSLAT